MKTIQRQGTAPVGVLLLQYSIPAIAGFLANALYQFVDRVLVGRGVGTEAMAAVTCAYPLTLLAMGIGLLLNVGAGNGISTLLGQGRRAEAERVLGQSVRLAVTAGGALAGVYVAAARPLLRLCGAEGAVLEQAVPFLRAVAPGQLCMIGGMCMGNIMRVQGRPNLGLALMVSGNALNAGLAAWAIFGLRLGVVGAGAATSVSSALGLAALVAFTQSRLSHLHLHAGSLRRDATIARDIVRLGAPMLVLQVLASLVFLAANHGASRLAGARGVAAVGVFNAVSMLLVYGPLGVTQAMQPLVAYNRGAGRPDRVRALLARTLATTVVMGAALAAVVFAVPGEVAALFTRTDAELVAIVRAGLRWAMPSVVMFGVAGTASFYYLATQRPREASLLLLGRQLLAAPLFLVLPALFGFTGLYVVALAAELPFTLVALALLRREWRALSAAVRAREGGAAATIALA